VLLDTLRRRIRQHIGLEATPRSIPMYLLRHLYGATRWTTIDGLQLLVDLHDTGIGFSLIFRKRWEPLETAVIDQLLHSGATALDIGANIGYYTTRMARAVGARGAVWAFEPDSRAFAMLAQSIARNGFVSQTRLMPIAAGAGNGQGTLFLGASGNRGDHRMYDSADDAIFTPGKKREGVHVVIASVDDTLSDNESVDLVKIDVQGFEPYVLDGMQRTLERSPQAVILTEFWPYGIMRAGRDPSAYLNALAGLGFALWAMPHETRQPESTPLDPGAIIARFSPAATSGAPYGFDYIDLVCARTSETISGLRDIFSAFNGHGKA